MNILIDLILVVFAALAVVAAARKGVAHALVHLAAITAATAAALLLTVPVTERLQPVLEPYLAPMTQDLAAKEFASLAGVPEKEEPADTLAQVDWEELREKQPERLSEAADSFGLTTTELLTAAREEKAAEALGAPLLHALCLGISGILLALAAFLLVLLVLTLILKSKKVRSRKKPGVLSVLLGILVAAVFVILLIVPFFELFRPYSAGLLKTMRWDENCEASLVYGLLCQCHSFLYGLL